MPTRGIRNNNPGNIDKGQKWQGLAAAQTDSRFCTFSEPKWGIRAMCKLYQTYAEKYSLRTLRLIVGRYAPPNENNTENYLANVTKWSGIGADTVLNLRDRKTLLAIIPAFIRMEQGVNPYDGKTIAEGVDLSLT